MLSAAEGSYSRKRRNAALKHRTCTIAQRLSPTLCPDFVTSPVLLHQQSCTNSTCLIHTLLPNFPETRAASQKRYSPRLHYSSLQVIIAGVCHASGTRQTTTRCCADDGEPVVRPHAGFAESCEPKNRWHRRCGRLHQSRRGQQSGETSAQSRVSGAVA